MARPKADDHKAEHGPKKYLVSLPGAIELPVEANSELEAIAAYNLMAGVISTQQVHQVVEQAEPATK